MVVPTSRTTLREVKNNCTNQHYSISVTLPIQDLDLVILLLPNIAIEYHTIISTLLMICQNGTHRVCSMNNHISDQCV